LLGFCIGARYHAASRDCPGQSYLCNNTQLQLRPGVAAAIGAAQGGHDHQRGGDIIYDSTGNRTSRTDNRTNTTLTYTYDDI